MRLGAPVKEYDSPETWIAQIQAGGYRAAYCPVDTTADSKTIRAYEVAAKAAGIVIAEVGVWNNPISPNDDERKAAIEKCEKRLALADEIGAMCCVNVSGSRSPSHWFGPHPLNLEQETFDLIVETTQAIIDAVKPERTVFALEMMPATFPDSVDSYLELIEAIDREQFGVHLDPVNIINSPRRYFNNGDVIRDCFTRLGKWIKSCHAKDIQIGEGFPVQLNEVRPGSGTLDYAVFLSEASKLAQDVPIMLEHLPMEEYPIAADYVRSVAKDLKLTL